MVQGLIAQTTFAENIWVQFLASIAGGSQPLPPLLQLHLQGIGCPLLNSLAVSMYKCTKIKTK